MVVLNGTELGQVEVDIAEDPPRPASAITSWRGTVTDDRGVDLWSAAGETVTLRLPNGDEGEALLTSSDGRLAGTGPFPGDT